MPKPLAVITANDPVSALLTYAEVLSGDKAIFIAPGAIGGIPPELEALPGEVENHIAAIVESSGTTGNPKRISLSLAALLHSARAGQNRLGPAGQWLLALPINFIAGQQVLIRSLLADTQPVIMNTAVPFTAEAFMRSAQLMQAEHKYTSLVPLQLTRLIKLAEEDSAALKLLQSFRAILVGGQATPDELRDRALALGLRVVISYGMTETCGGCVYDGIPLDGVRLKIAPDGRLLIQGKVLAEDQQDWIFTNDLAELSATGELKILGRSDRVIISGGIKMALDRVEYLGGEVPGVSELVAVSLADEQWGERVGICYVGSPEVADDIANRLAELLGPAGKPIRIVRVDKLPKLKTGKSDLMAIRQVFQEEAS
jgi:O-succinylbenzoic acid--CoA ligase